MGRSVADVRAEPQVDRRHVGFRTACRPARRRTPGGSPRAL
jgi:hypothetical protein